MKKGDLILIGVFLLLGGIILVTQFAGKEAGEQVVITLEGKTYKVLDLKDNQELKVKGKEGHYNVVVIKNGQVTIKEADCKNQVCVNTAPIDSIGESIACLPHKLIVKIVAKDENLEGENEK
ncbi:NusG domain II-containing protein [[Clostridium] polysaccharolyticum]|uniref:Uncharacterized protein n=1 Tax=[Clostridium] polysaccharolyticum TaxID=29364 RepID=A0A1I0BVR4_9FIRM|nr:NusG domain II-containing protein [[Clostridium] polysaccharolyticum]SET10449.1 hypothetical protein SAMN04487772_10895 [[Clostridium] polysaccharolyticum]